MSEKLSLEQLKEELEKAQRTCAELRVENLRYVEIIQKLKEELNTSKLLVSIPLSRAEALEKYRIEYWARLGLPCPTEEEDYSDNDGFDEIDGLS